MGKRIRMPDQYWRPQMCQGKDCRSIVSNCVRSPPQHCYPTYREGRPDGCLDATSFVTSAVIGRVLNFPFTFAVDEGEGREMGDKIFFSFFPPATANETGLNFKKKGGRRSRNCIFPPKKNNLTFFLVIASHKIRKKINESELKVQQSCIFFPEIRATFFF